MPYKIAYKYEEVLIRNDEQDSNKDFQAVRAYLNEYGERGWRFVKQESVLYNGAMHIRILFENEVWSEDNLNDSE